MRAGSIRASVSGMGLGRLLDGRDDAEVSAAAADVAVHVAHDVFAAGVRGFLQQRHAGDDHAGSAIAALHGALLEEGVLQRVVDAFDGRDLFAGGGAHGEFTRADGLAIEQHGAGAALAFAASVLGAGKVEVVAEDGEQGDVGVGVDGPAGSVYGEFGDPGHKTIVPLVTCFARRGQGPGGSGAGVVSHAVQCSPYEVGFDSFGFSGAQRLGVPGSHRGGGWRPAIHLRATQRTGPPAGERAVGVLPGDRVAVLAPNTATALEAHFGVLMAGAVLVMLNTRLQAGELAWVLKPCAARVAIG